MRHAADDDEAGRGLTLVVQLSAARGVEPGEDHDGLGKAVWFELQLPGMDSGVPPHDSKAASL